MPVRPSRLTRAYNEGRSPQPPAGIVLNVGNRHINRKLGFKGKVVQYEHPMKTLAGDRLVLIDARIAEMKLIVREL